MHKADFDKSGQNRLCKVLGAKVMDDKALKSIEAELSIALPDYYSVTMLSYPFEKDSFADEFLLLNDNKQILELNGLESDVLPPDVFYCVGSDGGEHYYYIKLDCLLGKVYEYSLETDVIKLYSESWDSYLADISNTLSEIESDEKLIMTRKLNKKWWQFWV